MDIKLSDLYGRRILTLSGKEAVVVPSEGKCLIVTFNSPDEEGWAATLTDQVVSLDPASSACKIELQQGLTQRFKMLVPQETLEVLKREALLKSLKEYPLPEAVQKLKDSADMSTVDAVRAIHTTSTELLDTQHELKNTRHALDEFMEKTDWVQDTATGKELGMHRADVLRSRIKDLTAQLALHKPQIKITKQGFPKVNDLTVIESTSKVLVAMIDLSTKRCRVGSFYNLDGEPGLEIFPTDGTPTLEAQDDLYKGTVIAFEGFENWSVHSANIAKYTLYVTLWKR